MSVAVETRTNDNRQRVRRVVFRAFPGPQKRFLECKSPFVAFFSGFGGGKTWAGACKAVLDAMGPGRGRDGLVVAPSFGDLETFVVPELMSRLGEVGVRPQLKMSSPPRIWWWQVIDGVRKQINIHLRSGAHPESISGFQVGWAWIDEACRIPAGKTPTKDVKTQVVARLRAPNEPWRQLFITSTHEGELTWPAQDWVEKPKPGHIHFRGSTYDNHYMQEYADTLMAQYDPRVVEQYVHGHAVTVAGVLVYYEYEHKSFPEGNLDESVVLEPNRPVVLSLDFNIAPGMHGVIGQHHGDTDEFWVVDELHEMGMHVPKLVSVYAKKIRTMLGGQRVLTQIHGDSTGHGRDTAVGESAYYWVHNSLREEGLLFNNRVPKAAPFVVDTITSINAALRDGKGRHLRIHPRCKRLIRDLRNVQRDERGRIDKSLEGQGLTHLSDALRYWVHRERPVRKPTVSSFSYSKG